MIDIIQVRMVFELLIAVTIWPFLLGVYLFVGSRQWRAGQGSAGRLWRVAALAATLASLPMLIWLVVLLPPYSAETSWWFALGLTAVSAVRVGQSLTSTARLHGGSKPLPIVCDEEIVSRVRELSARMGIDPPQVRRMASLAYRLELRACVGGLACPMVVLMDGILHRLNARERDTVIAHELAHIATASLWWYAAMIPIAAVAAYLSSAFMPMTVAAATGVAVYAGVGRLISRRLEFLCDMMAADATGFAETASALQKGYAEETEFAGGFWSLLANAMSAGPALATRLSMLRMVAPADEKDAIEFSPRSASTQRMASMLVLTSWVGAIGTALWFAYFRGAEVFAIVLLLLVAFFPLLIDSLYRASDVRTASRRLALGLKSLPLSHGLVLLWLGILAFNQLSNWEITLWMGGVGLLCWYMFVALIRWTLQLQFDVAAAIGDGDYAQAVQLGEANPKRVRKDRHLRLNVALARVLNGDRADGIEELRDLTKEEPELLVAQLILAVVLLDEDPQKTVEVASEIVSKMRNDPLPLVIKARGYRRLGQIEEAAEAIGDAMALKGDRGLVLAVAAWIATDQGDTERAERLIEEAERYTPGDAFCLVAAAELALATGTQEESIAAVKKAAAAAGHAPLAFLGGEVARLRGHPLVAEHFAAAEEPVWAEDGEEG